MCKLDCLPSIVFFTVRDITSQNDQTVRERNLNNILKWCNECGMFVNAEKSVFCFVLLVKKKRNFLYTLGSSALRVTNNYKYLGRNLTSTLSWNVHINYICSSDFHKLFPKTQTEKCPS